MSSYTAQDIIAKRLVIWEAGQDIDQDKEFTRAVAKYLISAEGAGLRREIAGQPELLIQMVFVIVDKEQRTVPFFLNEVQQSFIAHLNQAIEEHQAGRRPDLKEKLKQEYPCSAEEAFLSSGRCVFDKASIVLRYRRHEETV